MTMKHATQAMLLIGFMFMTGCHDPTAETGFSLQKVTGDFQSVYVGSVMWSPSGRDLFYSGCGTTTCTSPSAVYSASVGRIATGILVSVQPDRVFFLQLQSGSQYSLSSSLYDGTQAKLHYTGPEFLTLTPDAHYAFGIRRSAGIDSLVRIDLTTGERRALRLQESSGGLLPAPDGSEAIVRQSVGLMRVRMDGAPPTLMKALAPEVSVVYGRWTSQEPVLIVTSLGGPFSVLHGSVQVANVALHGDCSAGGSFPVAFSSDETRLAALVIPGCVSTDPTAPRELHAYVSGSDDVHHMATGSSSAYTFSPDGRQLAYHQNGTLWVATFR